MGMTIEKRKQKKSIIFRRNSPGGSADLVFTSRHVFYLHTHQCLIKLKYPLYPRQKCKEKRLKREERRASFSRSSEALEIIHGL